MGASHAVGHLLRDGRLPEPSEEREVPVLIAGGGMAGLSAGWKLAREGFRDFEILDLEAAPGGTSRWGESSATAFPWGAHYVPVPGEHARAVRELFTEMGLYRVTGNSRGAAGASTSGASTASDDPASDLSTIDERYLCHAPQERLFLDGQWHQGIFPAAGMDAAEEEQVAAFENHLEQWRAWRDEQGRPAFAVPRAAGSDAEQLRALDQISLDQYLRERGWDSPRLRWYLDYCCRDDYGCTLENTSAWAGLYYFCSRSADVAYLTWPEGNGRIVRHLVERIGAERIRTGALVYRIEDRGEEVWVDVLHAESGVASRLRARQVVVALPRFLLPRVMASATQIAADRFTYAPWMVANLAVRRVPTGAAWENVQYRSPSLGYVVATHQSLSPQVARGPSVLTYYRALSHQEPTVARQEMLERSWESWVEDIFYDLRWAHPEIDELVTRVDLMLWGHAMVRPLTGFCWSEELARAAQPQGRLHFAHSDLSAMALFEEAQYWGVRAAEGVLRSLGQPFSSSL